MIHDGLEFHNVVELVAVEGEAGLRLQRAPESVREQVSEGTAGVMMSPAGCEIRFRLADGVDSASVTLSSKDGATVYLYHGPFQGRSFVIGAEPLEIKVKPGRRSSLLEKTDYPPRTFSGLFSVAYIQSLSCIMGIARGSSCRAREMCHGEPILHTAARLHMARSLWVVRFRILLTWVGNWGMM